ncbi:DUF2851 family protein [Chitinophagaceae bacterium LWZ2-11]
MTEKLLHFLWQFQYFNKEGLFTQKEEELTVLKPGQLNFNQGPDFLEAVLQIGPTKWVGNVEIHIKSSDWLKHNHSGDFNYSNVILHVVWMNDVDISDPHGNIIPTLELENRVPKVLIERYIKLMLSPRIPCQHNSLPGLDDLGWMSWKERLVAERLERKAAKVLDHYENTNHHWEEVFWRMLASNFGMRVNAELFENIALSIPITTLAKHKNQIHQLEALLFGQANLLNESFEEKYPILLQKEYQFLQKKYSLKSQPVKPMFLRMRPANLPTIRLAQLAMLIYKSSGLFAAIKEKKNIHDLIKLFDVTGNDYWSCHYMFDKETAFSPKVMGEEMINNIIINTVAPVLFAYGLYNKDEKYKEKAIEWLTQIKYENNTIIKSWKDLGQKSKTAFDSQAFLELTNNYCEKKGCLDCAVGVKILKGSR